MMKPLTQGGGGGGAGGLASPFAHKRETRGGTDDVFGIATYHDLAHDVPENSLHRTSARVTERGSEVELLRPHVEYVQLS